LQIIIYQYQGTVLKTIAGAMPAFLATLHLDATDRNTIFFIISEALFCNDGHQFYFNFHGIHSEPQF
jgi:hypothetical protein